VKLLQSAATVSALTFLSRITGLMRETLTARMFGAGSETDAFFVAFRIPNLLRRLFAEGAFSQAFVPILAEYKSNHDPAATKTLVDLIASALLWGLLLITLIGIVVTPFLVHVMASGFAQQGATFDLTVQLTRIMFPYIILISLVAFSAGVLNTWQIFKIPAFSPVLLNLSFISCALLLAPYLNQHGIAPVYALSVAVILGGILQLAIQLPALIKIGMLPRLHINLRHVFSHAAVLRVLKQMLPACLGVSVAQISLMINTNIASTLPAGSVSWLSYADRLMEFPTALLGVALGTILLPNLSRAAQQQKIDLQAGQTPSNEFSQLLDWGLRLVVLFSIPASIGLWLMAQPLTSLLFEYGKFSHHDALQTALAVRTYGVGLLGLIATKILAPGFYAHQNIRTPVKIAIGILILTQIFNFLFVPWLGHAGLALSIGLGAWGNAALLLIGLCYSKRYQPLPGWGMWLFKIVLSSLVMIGLIVWAQHLMPLASWGKLGAAFHTLGLICASIMAYFATLWMQGIKIKTLLR
jgi:putative peptidoglycan lipid II flippase